MKKRTKNKQVMLYNLFETVMTCRADIVAKEIMTEQEVLEIGDDDMEKLSHRVGECLMQDYWVALEDVFNYYKEQKYGKRT